MKNLRSSLAIAALLIIAISCRNRAKINNDLKQYFDLHNVDGSFSMFNNSSGEVIVYNLALDTTKFTPASTFKIVNSLIGLETAVILNDTMLIKWDGVVRQYPNGDTATAWNKDLHFDEAFKASAVPYFQEVARRIGRDTMQRYLDTLGYGNKTIGKNIDSFWLDNSLKVSPDEQVGLLKRLFFDQLPFSRTTQQQVRNVMLQESNTAYKLSYKTGWGYDEQNNSIGWLVGWLEQNNQVFFFSTLVKTPNKNLDMKTIRLAITKDILKHLNVLKNTGE